jgi:hypothetical protein
MKEVVGFGKTAKTEASLVILEIEVGVDSMILPTQVAKKETILE